MAFNLNQFFQKKKQALFTYKSQSFTPCWIKHGEYHYLTPPPKEKKKSIRIL